MKRLTARRLSVFALAFVASGTMLPLAHSLRAEPPATVTELTDRVWADAKTGKFDDSVAAIRQLAGASDGQAAGSLRTEVKSLDEAIAKREQMRAEQIAKVSKELDETMAGELTPTALSKALRQAVELHMLSLEKDTLISSERFTKLIKLADAAAREAEAKGDWMTAAELFGRLNLLLEEQATYKHDARRLGDRLGMIRLYVPQRLWELRNARRLEDKLSPLPAYNGTGEDYQDKLRGVDAGVVLRALGRAAEGHVERVSMRDMLVGGLEAVRTLVTTHDLEAAMPGIADADARRTLLEFIETEITSLKNGPATVSAYGANAVIDKMLAANAKSTKILPEALLHEFGNGAFNRLDEFSQIIWPDEVARFKRMTEGSFVGVGIQIQMDEETQMIKVVTPLDGTPAQQAGVRAGDMIKRIGDKQAIGMSLDQAVEQITGAAGTKVNLTVEREGEDIDFPLTRTRIKLGTIKGWARSGAGEMDWNWYVDPESQIGYVRISNFNESTTRDLLVAVGQMKKQGLKGLVLDLRFNPGGLLDQAVSVSNLFINDGVIVYTEAAGGVRQQTETAEAGRARLRDIPTVVLINDTSASASEIVSGAIRYYADKGAIPALILGSRSYGKGSVQNVLPLSNTSQLKITTQYYHLPGGQLIHRRDGAKNWGVEPHLRVEMLPRQSNDALVLRADADLPPGAVRPKPVKPKEGEVAIDSTRNGPPDPQRLLSEGIDLQLETAVLLLRARAVGTSQAQAAAAKEKVPG